MKNEIKSNNGNKTANFHCVSSMNFEQITWTLMQTITNANCDQ